MHCLRSLGSRDRGVESHTRHGCLACVGVCVVLCLGRGLATSWSLVQGVLPSVKWSWNWKSEARAQGRCTVSEKKNNVREFATQYLLSKFIFYMGNNNIQTSQNLLGLSALIYEINFQIFGHFFLFPLSEINVSLIAHELVAKASNRIHKCSQNRSSTDDNFLRNTRRYSNENFFETRNVTLMGNPGVRTYDTIRPSLI
jgi:hypothetical protein